MTANVVLPASNYKPLAKFGLFTIFLAFGGLSTWAGITKLDSAVIAPGSISIESNRKVVQHLEGGIVEELAVQEWQVVKAGDVLVRLRPVLAEATETTQRLALDAATALEARLTAEQRYDPAINFPKDLLSRNDPHTARIIEDQKIQFEQRRKSLVAQIDIYYSRIRQARQMINGLTAQLMSSERQLASLTAEYVKIERLAAKSYFPLNRLMEMERRKDEQWGRVHQLRAEIARSNDSVNENELLIVQTKQKFQEDVAQAQREARIQVNELTEKLRIAKDILSRVVIRAPRAGMVQNLKVHTLGGVIRGGETILEIVPFDDALIVQARISAVDINYVRPQGPAEVRFPGVKDRTVAMVMGRVVTVSSDVIIDERSREPYYLANVEIKQSDLPQQLRGKLRAGMPCEIIMSTGERTVANYLIAPLYDSITKTMRER